MRITFLGTGTSHGVPTIGCRCPVCRSTDPRDRRWRSSILIERSGASVIVDSGPEFRLQCLRAGLRSLDLLLLTHAHADHIAGLDDVRPLSQRRVLPVYGNAEAVAEARSRFAYAFAPRQIGGGLPRFELRVVSEEGMVFPRSHEPAAAVESGRGAVAHEPDESPARILPIPLMHGILPILGWRIGGFAYLTDCSQIPAASFGLLEGVRVLVIDALRFKPHETHFSVDQALAAAERIGAKETWLTHIDHEASHAELEAYCAERGSRVGARPAWDGLVLEPA